MLRKGWQRFRHPEFLNKTFDFRGFAINAKLAKITGAPKENYALLAELHEKFQSTWAPVAHNHVVLEAGCGTGMDAILLTEQLSSSGRYTGFDIDLNNIKWCSENITSRFPNFNFIHFDVFNSTFNPDGKLSAIEFNFPEEEGTVDRFIAQSVFTHLLPDVVAHYFHEIRRVLHPKGLALLTCFVGNLIEIESSIANDFSNFRFPYQFAPGVYVNNLNRPSDSIVYKNEIFTQLINNAGLCLNTMIPGNWAQSRSTHNFGQDIIILSAGD